tara:strand:+ start:542 stop:859 length:318 start_codon:yes stop_codon:yes gene_type:complete
MRKVFISKLNHALCVSQKRFFEIVPIHLEVGPRAERLTELVRDTEHTVTSARAFFDFIPIDDMIHVPACDGRFVGENGRKLVSERVPIDLHLIKNTHDGHGSVYQ